MSASTRARGGRGVSVQTQGIDRADRDTVLSLLVAGRSTRGEDGTAA